MSTRPYKGKLNDGKIPLRERRTLAEEWRSFSALIPREAELVQRVEMKRAFFAGAAAFMRLAMGNLDAEHEPTELDLAYMDGLNDELLVFAREIGSAAERQAAQDEARR